MVDPVDTWEQCKCGLLYIDATVNPPKVGFLDEQYVEYAADQKLGPKKRVQRSGDKFTGSGTFDGQS